MKRLPGILALSICGIAAGGRALASCSPTLFIEAATYLTGAGSSRTLATADFDGDGLPDVAVASDNPRVLSVLLNDGNGGLRAPIVTTLNDDPRAIAAADLRGNGTTDVILASYSGIYVLLGHNDGTFDAPVFYEADVSNILSMIVGKFDGNDTWDVAVGGYYSDTIALLPGNGNGTFGAALHTGPTSQVRSMTTGDFNSDGHLDLAASTPNAVGVYLGNGDGTFSPPAYFIAGADLSGIASGDFDGDGHADLAVGSGTYLSILIGDGAGSFQAALQYPAGINPVGGVRVADVDQNGTADIVVGEQLDFNGPGAEIAVLRGAGDGSFSAGEAYASAGSAGISVADIDDDGLPDIVATGGAVVSVLRDTPDGNLVAVPNSRLDGPNNSAGVARGDFNGDGYFDFAWIYADEVLVVYGGPGGRFAEAPPLDMGTFSGAQPGAVAAISFPGDDRASLAVTTYNDVLLFRSGPAGFDEPVSIFNGFSLTQIAVGDFDGVGGQDLAVAQGCCGSANIIALLGNGDGTFQPAVQTPVDFDVYRIVAADFTVGFPPQGHGFTDDLIVVANGSVRVMLSQPDGTFSVSAEIPTSPYVMSSVASARFSGLTDLLIAADESNVRLYPGNNNGTFQPPITIALPSSASSLAVGLYDVGLEWDFAALTQYGILVFPGLGDGHFQSPISLQTAVPANLIVTTDFARSGADGIAAIGTEGIAAFRSSRLAASVSPLYSVVLGSPAVLHAYASGYGPLGFQWRKDGVALADGGAISGSATDTLTIDPVSLADAGSYDVLVTDSCGNVASNAATLSVEFADVPVSSPFHDDILTIATAGITGGCGGANYCPASPVRRDQMAVFLLKSEHGSGYTPPACTGVFADVPCPSPFADWVEQLATEGVTGGCGGGNYCPAGSVTRAQMAVFLLKTSQGSGYAPPPATGIFGDVPVGSFAADFIEDLYNRGITGGCSASPLLYCPGSPVSRQQMATFIVRTFGL